jgi:hypothetical protein
MRRILTAVLTTLAMALILVTAAGTPAGAVVLAHTAPGPVVSGGADGRTVTATCGLAEHAVGGGYRLTAPAGMSVEAWDFLILENRPSDDARSWQAAMHAARSDDQPADLQVFVTCAV